MRTSQLALALVAAVGSSVAACATAPAPGPDRPGDASAAEVETTLEEAIARMERRQLEQLQRQRELEAVVAALAAEIERLGGRPLAAAQPEAPARPDTPRRADPDAIYAVPIEGSPTHGPDDAIITIVKATEFACPFCYRVRPALDELREAYGRDLRIVYKHFIVHPQQAMAPALAACAAHLQGRHEVMEPLIWERGFENNRDLSEANMKRIARDVGLDMARFERDMSGDTCRERIREDQEMLARVGARGTPTFFINGRVLVGARPVEHFRALIDEELEKARERVEAGTSRSDYYRTWVLERGAPSL
jgi:predicted DsbA family dithiol-disulfide isomerase